MVVVVLPTPPFWLHIEITRAGPCWLRGRGSGKSGIGRPVGPMTGSAVGSATGGGSRVARPPGGTFEGNRLAHVVGCSGGRLSGRGGRPDQRRHVGGTGTRLPNSPEKDLSPLI